MTKSFIPHLITVIFLHALVMIGFWQLSDLDFREQQFTKTGEGILRLQRASDHPTPRASLNKTTFKEKKIISTSVSSENVTPNESPISTTSAIPQSGGSLKGKFTELNQYKEELRAMIEKNKYYPAMSRRLGQTGTVVVAFTLLKDGHIIDVRIDRPSRFESLNNSALDAVKKVERFRPIPEELGETKMDIKVPLKFLTI